MITNTSVTIYALSDGGYKRIFVSEAFWDETERANTVKSGMTVTDSVSLFIPYSVAGELELTRGKDFICKGNVKFEFDNSSEQSQSLSMKEFRALYGAPHTVTSFDKKLFGSEDMWHYEISLK